MRAVTTRGRERRRPRSASAGFTLLEVVLALVIFSLLALMVYGAFYVGHRAVIAGEREADLSQRMRVVDDVVAHQVHSAVYYFARHDEDTVPYFLGRADAMSFVTAAPQSRGGTGLVVVTYRAVDGQLVLEERPGFMPDDLYDPPSDARVERAVLLSGVSALRFEYLPRDEVDGQWQEAWDARDEDGLPSAVRLSVEGLPWSSQQPWVRELPLMTVAYGWGTDDFQEPPDDEDESAPPGSAEVGGAAGVGGAGSATESDGDLDDDSGLDEDAE